MKKILLMILVFAGIFSLYAQSQEKFSGWKKAETEHFTFIYENASRETAESYAKIADDAWNKIAKVYSIPKNHLDVYITDRTNTVNAFTYFAPTEIGMFTTPPAINDFGFRADWKELFFTHELIHAANATFEDKKTVGENLFGPFVKNIDFSGVPGWALEGLTTVLETELTDGGRGRSPYFELEYKAPTLENSLISYRQIGLEQEPPRGQSYVMGYLIMRSIADRWGIQALADIERNRPNLGSWEESVKLVTGCTAEEIYQDVKIALVKKYAGERKIPEGITISPRTMNTNYYEPAFIFDDGSLIAIRDGEIGAVVKLNPALRDGSEYIELTNPEKDLNTVFNETILFEGLFPERHSITADENGTIYASMMEISRHKNPGVAVENAIYKWNENSGLKKLTEGASYVQPSVSKDGKTLVAMRQFGLNYGLVKIDVESGAETVILKGNQDFIQPSVNDDGKSLAFMALDGTRAKICTMQLDSNPSEKYEVIYNGDGEISDPSYPHWVGKNLVITDNQRGRLEAFEYSFENDEFVPVVSDPSGVLWATKNKKGIYYTTFSATGYVIKMKPESEWGTVPDFDGPSMPGKIIAFGNLENDYPDFKPYEKLSEIEVPEKSFRELLKEEKNRNKNEPVAIKGKTVKHRKEENIQKLNDLPPAKTELSAEKSYVPFPEPLLYLPFVNVVSDAENSYFGFGAFALCLTPKLQMNFGALFIDAFYYPEIKNFQFNFDYYAPIGKGTFQLFADRILSDYFSDELLENAKSDENDSNNFIESNCISVGYKHPLFNINDSRKSTVLNLFTSAMFKTSFSDKTAFAAFSKDDYDYCLDGILGLEFNTSRKRAGIVYELQDGMYGLGFYDFNLKKVFAGIESEFTVRRGSALTGNYIDAGFKIRYTDFPHDALPSGSLVTFNGKALDCKYPGRAVFQVGNTWGNMLGIGLDSRIYAEGLCSFGQNSVDSETPLSGKPINMNFADKLAFGYEIGLITDELNFVCGYSVLGNPFDFDDLLNGNFYLKLKMDWFRYRKGF